MSMYLGAEAQQGPETMRVAYIVVIMAGDAWFGNLHLFHWIYHSCLAMSCAIHAVHLSQICSQLTLPFQLVGSAYQTDRYPS